MASSSSFVPTQRGGWTYDVFLCFKGRNTRFNFVDHLYTALNRIGLTVFKDDKMSRVGKEISPEVLKAIQESTCTVVVFSKKYAYSSWCLAVLAKVMECHNQNGQLVIPVFYHVDPSDVRGQKRNFETAFQEHELLKPSLKVPSLKASFLVLEDIFKVNMDKVKKWRQALTAAANLPGYYISGTKGESSFITQIVQGILAHVQPHVMEDDLIGITSHINELKSLLNLEATQEVRMVGIWGMGGIGKTSIARALFRRISYKFEGSSFVKGVRENSKKDICVLQQKILKDVLATYHESNIMDPDDGAELIQTRFCNKKVLLVLDDVDDVKQLESLAATHEWFGAGSRIIITTRDVRFLKHTNVMYKPALLVKDQAIELFSRHAFQNHCPPNGYEKLSKRAIHYSGGLPLALKVLGSYFHGKEAGVWESALNRLAKTPNIEIFEILKVSFDGLEASEKTIFLDIACFFKGHDEEQVTRVLKSFGFDVGKEISTLKEKSLITISSKRIDIHDVLQEMALEIVRESYPNSRLWQCEEIHDIITNNRNLDGVEAIVSTYNHENMGFSADIFEKMKNIRLLDICSDFTSCEPTTLPDELRWLRWSRYPFSSLPVANLQKLVGLEIVFGKVEHIQLGYKIMSDLKFIHLERLGCKSFPDVSSAPNVERLTLSDCTKLVKVHESLVTLRKLAYLNMSGCWNLKCIPSMIEMISLEALDLSYCLRLKKFPEVSSRMEKLSFIHLNGCSSLKTISSSICELKNLKSLHLYDCMQLQELPKEMGSMENLQELQLGLRDYNMAFQRQPDSINFQTLTTLFCLRKLDLSLRPIENQDFLNNLDAFSSVELHLSGNSKLVQLPASISRLSSLRHLELNDCQQLHNIQGLPSRIQVLKACDCISLEKIEDLTEEYEWLYKIWLHGCEMLQEDQENERYLDKMLQPSFLKKCAIVDNVLSIAIPGNKIPSWFEEQRHGSQIALKFPPKRHTDILGFAVCGVLQRKWQRGYVQIINTCEIHFTVGNDNRLIRVPEVDDINASDAATVDDINASDAETVDDINASDAETVDDINASDAATVDDINASDAETVDDINASDAATVDDINASDAAIEDDSVWIVYVPFSLFQEQMHDDFGGKDWFLYAQGNIIISILEPKDGYTKIVKCGAHIMYKEDVGSIQCIPDYKNSILVHRLDDSFAYIETFRNIDLQIPTTKEFPHKTVRNIGG